jgi:sporulation protein YlmC with PRC-barrel domain
MKRLRDFFFSAAVLISSSLAPGAVVRADEAKPAPIVSTADSDHRSAGASARDVLGREVRGSDGEKLGELKDLVVASGAGKIVYGLVGSGGVLGVGTKIRAVPFASLSVPMGRTGAISIPVTKAKWENAAVLDEDELDLLGVESRGRGLFEYYGQDWERELASLTAKPGEKSFRLLRIAPLLGKKLRNAGQDVGEIEDVIVNFETRRASALIDADDDYVGSPEKFLVSFNQVMISPDKKDTIATPLTRAEFAAAKPVHGDWWGVTTGYPYVWSGYGYTQGVGYLPLNPAAVPANAASRAGNAKENRIAVADVREALAHDAALADAAQHIILREEGKQLVVRGTVSSRELRKKIGDRVEDLAKGWDVENELSVKSASE